MKSAYRLLLSLALLLSLGGCIPVTPTPTATPPPTATATATPTLTPTATHTPFPTSTPTPTIVPTPTATPSGPGLGSRISQLIAAGGSGGSYAIAAINLKTNERVYINAQEAYPAASVIKLPVLWEVFAQRSENTLSLNEVVTLTAAAVAYDQGTLVQTGWRVGSTPSISEATRAMITISDNASTIALRERVGRLAINQRMQRLGWTLTRVDADLFALNNLTSAENMAVMLDSLLIRQARGDADAEAMLRLLLAQKNTERIPALLPPGAPVAHKTGTLPGDGVRNDVGIIYRADRPDEPAFILCILTKDLSNEAAADGVIARIALAFWETWVK